MINDNQRLVSATNEYGRKLPIYDDGFGQLWIHRDSMGISGIVRATSWEEAYGICEDEFFPEASETYEEMESECATIYMSGRELWDADHPGTPFHTLTESKKLGVRWLHGRHVPFDGHFTDHPCWQEAYGFRPNGRRSMENGVDRDPIGHGIYAKDLNGDRLDPLTPELCRELGITLEIKDEE
jgi:hypothetical protein